MLSNGALGNEVEGIGEKCGPKHLEFFFSFLLLLFGLYVWIHTVQFWNEQVKPLHYCVGIKSRSNGAILLGSDFKFST